MGGDDGIVHTPLRARSQFPPFSALDSCSWERGGGEGITYLPHTQQLTVYNPPPVVNKTNAGSGRSKQRKETKGRNSNSISFKRREKNGNCGWIARDAGWVGYSGTGGKMGWW